MSNCFDLARYEWLKSQRNWHASQLSSKWHKSQIKWYNAKICTMPGVFTAIVNFTIQAHTHAIARNITHNNALLSKLKERADGPKIQ